MTYSIPLNNRLLINQLIEEITFDPALVGRSFGRLVLKGDQPYIKSSFILTTNKKWKHKNSSTDIFCQTLGEKIRNPRKGPARGYETAEISPAIIRKLGPPYSELDPFKSCCRTIIIPFETGRDNCRGELELYVMNLERFDNDPLPNDRALLNILTRKVEEFKERFIPSYKERILTCLLHLKGEKTSQLISDIGLVKLRKTLPKNVGPEIRPHLESMRFEYNQIDSILRDMKDYLENYWDLPKIQVYLYLNDPYLYQKSGLKVLRYYLTDEQMEGANKYLGIFSRTKLGPGVGLIQTVQHSEISLFVTDWSSSAIYTKDYGFEDKLREADFNFFKGTVDRHLLIVPLLTPSIRHYCFGAIYTVIRDAYTRKVNFFDMVTLIKYQGLLIQAHWEKLWGVSILNQADEPREDRVTLRGPIGNIERSTKEEEDGIRLQAPEGHMAVDTNKMRLKRGRYLIFKEMVNAGNDGVPKSRLEGISRTGRGGGKIANDIWSIKKALRKYCGLTADQVEKLMPRTRGDENYRFIVLDKVWINIVQSEKSFKRAENEEDEEKRIDFYEKAFKLDKNN